MPYTKVLKLVAGVAFGAMLGFLQTAHAQQVSVNYNHDKSFAQYHTMPGEPPIRTGLPIPFWPRKRSRTLTMLCRRKVSRWCRRTRTLT